MATASVLKYTPKQIAEWNALFDFHEKYTTADSVPHMPITLSLHGSGRDGRMNGAPISWAELWHWLKTHARSRGGEQAPGGEEEDGAAAGAAASTARPVVQRELPLLNGVTGSNLPRAYRRAAAAREAESEATDALEETLPAGDIEEKGLYFIETADGAGEGEFRVGVARVQGALDANGLVPVAWYTRKHTKDAAWGSGNMALVPYMVQACQRLRRVGTSSEDPEHFLPVKVELTGKSVAPTAASIAGSAVKLTMRCVDRLRAYLERRRPDLIVGGEGGGAAARTAAAASGCSAADGRGGGRGSAAGGRSRGRGKSKAAGSADSSEASRSSDADEDDESG